MEVQAEPLGVPEDPPAQVQQDVLVDPGADLDEGPLEQGAEQRAAQVGGHHRDQRSGVVLAQGGDAPVHREGDQQRSGLQRGLLEQDHRHGGGDPAPVRAEQRAQQGARRAGRDGDVLLVGRWGRQLLLVRCGRVGARGGGFDGGGHRAVLPSGTRAASPDISSR